MGVIDFIFGKRSTVTPGLPTLASLGYSAPEDVISENMEALKSDNWRDWEKVCKFLGYARIDAAIPVIQQLVSKPEAKTIPNVSMLVAGTVFNIGGISALRSLETLSTFSDETVSRCAPIGKWAGKLAEGLQQLKSSGMITRNVKDFVLDSRVESYKPDWGEEDLAKLSVAELWGLSAAEPGMLFHCMAQAAHIMEEKIRKHEKITSGDKRFTKEFGTLGSTVKIAFYQIESYIGYYTDPSDITDSHRRVNAIVCEHLGGW